MLVAAPGSRASPWWRPHASHESHWAARPVARRLAGEVMRVSEDKSIPRPVQYLQAVNRRMKSAKPWRIYDETRARRDALGGWPEWCYCPVSIVFDQMTRLDTQLTHAPFNMGALAAWRLTQGVYRFDDTIFDELWHTPLNGDLPIDLLFRMPEWCMYIEVGREAAITDPHEGQTHTRLHGFFVFLDHRPADGAPVLYVLSDYDDRVDPWTSGLEVAALKLTGTLDESIGGMYFQSSMRAHEGKPPFGARLLTLRAALRPLVSLTLYLCSSEPDLRDDARTGRAPRMPTAIVTKKHGARMHAADNATTWNVGYRLGAAIRRARGEVHEGSQAAGRARGNGADGEASPRSAPVGHVRRAHWHTFWTGPIADPEKRRRVVKWLPPIAVNLDNIDELIPTVKPVRT